MSINRLDARELAKATGVSVETIHAYLRKGVLKPDQVLSPESERPRALFTERAINEVRALRGERDPDLMNAKEAAEYLAISKNHFSYLRKIYADRVPLPIVTLKIGQVMFRKADLDTWDEARKLLRWVRPNDDE